MNNKMININYLNRFIFLISFLLGILPLFVYYNIINKIKLLFNKEIYKEPLFLFFFIFLFFQFISLYLSIFIFKEINGRYFSIIHNYMVFYIFTFSIIWFKYFKNDEKIFLKNIKSLYFFGLIFSILSFIYSLKTGKTISYPGLIAILTGIKNNLTEVVINSHGYLENSIFPRTRIYGIYSNTSAIALYIITIIYLINYQYNTKLLKKIFFILISLFMILTTGSRITFVMFVAWSFFYIIKDIKKFYIFLTLFVLFIIFFYKDIIYILEIINKSRSSSTNTRLKLYQTSLSLMLNNNMFFGIGIKPKIYLIRDLPIGSHSTLIGYFVKNGILFGFYFVLFYIFLLISFFKNLLNKVYNQKALYIFGSFFLFIIFLFEDLDAYEFTAMLTGILLYFAFIKTEKK